MRDYFSDLLPVTHVTHPAGDCVTPARQEKPCNHAPLAEVSRTSRTSRKKKPTAEEKQVRPAVFEYHLADQPGPLVMISPPGSDLEHARRRLVHQFGADRVLDIQPRTKTTL